MAVARHHRRFTNCRVPNYQNLEHRLTHLLQRARAAQFIVLRSWSIWAWSYDWYVRFCSVFFAKVQRSQRSVYTVSERRCHCAGEERLQLELGRETPWETDERAKSEEGDSDRRRSGGEDVFRVQSHRKQVHTELPAYSGR